MFDFSPLHKTLNEQNKVISDMRDKVLNSRTIAKINRNEDVNLSTVAKICIFLNVPIEKVVEIKLDTADNKHVN